MADADEPPENATKTRLFWPRRRRWQALLVVSILLLMIGLATWRSRDRIADDVITSQLDRLGIEATYEIESIGPTRQVLRNVVIGDPARPDLSIERIELVPVVRFFGADIGSITLVRPRLRGTYRDGVLSFGALDPLLQSDSEEPFELPGWKLNLVDARARFDTDFGVVGAKAEGKGRLDDGFRGGIALSAPRLDIDSCEASEATLRGTMAISDGQPGFNGPLRISGISCPDSGVRLTAIDVATVIEADRELTGFEGKGRITTGRLAGYGIQSERLTGTVDFDWNDGLANARYRLAGEDLAAQGFSFAMLQATGAMRYRGEDQRIELDAGIEGRDLELNSGFTQTMADLRSTASGTLAEPFLAQLERGLDAALPGSALDAELTYRESGDSQSIVIPAARLRDRKGDSLFSLSRGQFSTRADGEMRLAGNFSTSGEGLPRIRGRMEQAAGGLPALRLEMAPYQAGDSRLAVPRLVLSQRNQGTWAIDGSIAASGAVPGGKVDGLDLPLSGRWSQAGGLTMWQDCAQIGFKSLKLDTLALARNQAEICPDQGGAILRSGPSGLSIAAKSEGLALAGTLGESPIRFASGPIRYSSQEGLEAADAQVELGEGDNTSRFALASLVGNFGEIIGGTVSGLEAQLAAVPLDVLSGAGEWRFADGVLTLVDASFELRDRESEPRFYPLNSYGAELTLKDGVITAEALLRHPRSERGVVKFDMTHDLANATGFADLAVPGLVFDDDLQPDQLTILSDGVIALAEGTITGGGRIDWNEEEITSSGAFSSDRFDFAAAFGPVKSVSGTVRFSDLLSLTTDGTQSLKIGSINPGVEVFDGVFDFTLRDQTFISIKGGTWPFFGGTMVLRPTELNLGVSEERRYVIEISGADAAQFIASMELGNISATGVFDGAVPLVFDEMGNGEIKSGLLISRPPGGNLSYVGELTYKDTGAIANFAFQSLRSLDFSQMMVEMNGPLTGEIITRLTFDGVSQGHGTSSNFITRQIAKLPIRFNVNIRAAFYELLTSLHGMYDPAFIRDPRSLGLLKTEGGRFVRPDAPEQPAIRPRDPAVNEPSIQTEESESLP